MKTVCHQRVSHLSHFPLNVCHNWTLTDSTWTHVSTAPSGELRLPLYWGVQAESSFLADRTLGIRKPCCQLLKRGQTPPQVVTSIPLMSPPFHTHTQTFSQRTASPVACVCSYHPLPRWFQMPSSLSSTASSANLCRTYIGIFYFWY